MPLAPIPDTTQVQVQGALAGGENWSNVLNFKRAVGAAFDAGHVEYLQAHIRSAYANVQSLWPTSTVLQTMIFRDLAVPGSSPVIVSTVPLGGSGALADALPNDIAHVVTITTGSGGRRGRGRIFIPGFIKTAITTTNVAGPQLTTAAATALAGIGDDLASATTATDPRLAVVSRVDNVARVVTGGYVDTKCDTMRRRDNRLSGVTRLPLTPSFPA